MHLAHRRRESFDEYVIGRFTIQLFEPRLWRWGFKFERLTTPDYLWAWQHWHLFKIRVFDLFELPGTAIDLGWVLALPFMSIRKS